MHSRVFFAGVVVLALAAQPVFAASPGQQGGSAPTAEHHPHGPLPKPVNLKVLPKNITPEHLHDIMHGYAGALGVRCDFCHVRNPQTHKMDFASDAKPNKTTARLMIRMTETINRKYLVKVNDPDATPQDKQVTCGTCHRGHHMPEHFVPPPEEHHDHPPAGGRPSGQ